MIGQLTVPDLREIELQSGRRMNAVQLQGEYLEMAQRYVTGRETDPGAREVLVVWGC